MDKTLHQEIESRVEALGFELVDIEQAGSKTRPILRLRLDRTDGAAVTVEDCTRVSRDIEAMLDETDRVSERYVLEVSSPGVERPLNKPKDYERFAGQKVAVKTNDGRVEGTLKGISGDVVTVDVNGQPVEIERAKIKRANLVFEWKKEKGK